MDGARRGRIDRSRIDIWRKRIVIQRKIRSLTRHGRRVRRAGCSSSLAGLQRSPPLPPPQKRGERRKERRLLASGRPHALIINSVECIIAMLARLESKGTRIYLASRDTFPSISIVFSSVFRTDPSLDYGLWEE